MLTGKYESGVQALADELANIATAYPEIGRHNNGWSVILSCIRIAYLHLK
jgi:hypothetical protein